MVGMIDESMLRDNVTAGGGIWLGIQTSIPPEPDKVMFKSMITKRTISLFVDKCSQYDVQHAIVQDAKPWYKESIKIKRNDLFELLGKLKRMEEFINELLEEKE